MCCPKCGSRAEVIETRGPFRDRRCTNASCKAEFTTREQIMVPRKANAKKGEVGRGCAKSRAAEIAARTRLLSAVSALKAVPCPVPGAIAESVLAAALQIEPGEFGGN